MNLKQLFPNASNDFLKLNSGADNSRGTPPIVEPGAGPATLEPGQAQEVNPGRVLVRVTSRRKRLIDEDNLCEKYHVDCCRYAGLISGDDPATAKIEVFQEKAGKGEDESVKIQIYKLD